MNIETQGKHHARMEADFAVMHVHTSNTEDRWQPPETRREARNDSPLGLLEGPTDTMILASGLQSSETINFCYFSHQIVGICYSSHSILI